MTEATTLEARLARRREQKERYRIDRREQINGKQREARKYTNRPFVGVDGEGGDIDGRHVYTTLRAGDRELYTGRPLTSEECLGFLADLPDKKIYVGFYFGYDIAKILEDLPLDLLQKLVNIEGRKVSFGKVKDYIAPIVWRGFQINYKMDGNVFSVRRMRYGREYTNIYDVARIFQSSFLKAIKAWEVATEEEYSIIESGKSGRGTWGMATPEIRQYNALECVLLARMMEKVRNACSKVGIYPKLWTGAGQLAQSLMDNHNMQDYIAPVPEELIEPTSCAFFGGRFEILVQGIVDDIWEYDINSAYPAAMYDLPCIKHGSWEKRSSIEDATDITLCHLQWRPKEGYHPLWDPGPFMFREKDGSIIAPAIGSGWYWIPEVRAAIASSVWDVRIDTVWSWVPECNHKPFAWVPDLYTYRKSLPSEEGIVLKLAINSLYGKTAQTIGKPRYFSSVYSGMITSRVRAQVYEAALKMGNCVMFATDAVYIKGKGKGGLILGDKLGEWEPHHFDHYFIMLPGLHFDLGGSKAKTRGMPISLLNKEELVRKFSEGCKQVGNVGVYSIELDNFWGLRVACHLNRKDMLGQWSHDVRKYAFASAVLKRQYEALYEYGSEKFYIMGIKWDTESDESLPYNKSLFVMEEQHRIEEMHDFDRPDMLEEFVEGKRYNGN